MFGEDDPASQAMIRVLDDFAAADDLLLLVSTPADTDKDRAVAELGAFAAPAGPRAYRKARRVQQQTRPPPRRLPARATPR